VSNRWNYIGDSVRGESHVRLDQPCQDAHQVGVLKSIEGDVLVVVCSDGAGSAALSREGATLACAAIIRYAEEYLQADRRVSEFSREVGLEWLAGVKAELDEAAAQAGLPIREFACTLLVALLSETHLFGLQVGDGAIIISKESVMETLFWPDQGEYANTTTFITGDEIGDHVFTALLEYPVRQLAVITDGLQRLALDFGRKAPHGPFFKPMFAQLGLIDDPSILQLPLNQFLTSSAVNERTDDDKTLVLAVKI
jgi:hypothetical protein